MLKDSAWSNSRALQGSANSGRSKQGRSGEGGSATEWKFFHTNEPVLPEALWAKLNGFNYQESVHRNQCLTWTLEKLSKQIVINCKILPVRKKFLPSKLRPSVEIIGKVWTANGRKKFSARQWTMPGAVLSIKF